MKRPLLHAALLLAAAPSTAQQWQRLVLPPGNPNSLVNEIRVSGQNDVVIVGYVGSSFGDTVRFGNGIELPFNNSQTQFGFVAAYSPNDQAMWAKRMGGDFCGAYTSGLAIDGADNIYVSGGYGGQVDLGGGVVLPPSSASGSCGCNAGDGFVVKFDPDGNALWAVAMGSSTDGCEAVRKLAMAPDGNLIGVIVFRNSVILNGQTHQADISVLATNADGVVFKMDTAGTILWSTTITGPGDEYFNTLSVDAGGNVLVGMKSDSNVLTAGGQQIALGTTSTYEDVLWKFDAGGGSLWAAAVADGRDVDGIFGLNTHHDAQPACATDLQNDNVYFTGSYSAASNLLRIIEANGNVQQVPMTPSADSFLPYLLAFDTDGMLLWNELAQDPNDRVLPYQLEPIPTGGVMVGGAFRRNDMNWMDVALPNPAPFPNDQNSLFVLRVDGTGQCLGEKRGYLGPESEINTMHRGANGELYCAGRASYWSTGNMMMDGFTAPLTIMGDIRNIYYAVLDGDPVLSVPQNVQCPSMSLFPIPARDRLTVMFDGPGKVRLRIVDSIGREWLRMAEMSSGQVLDISTLPRGMHVVQLIDVEGVRSSPLILY